MLVLTRKLGESIIIGDNLIKLKVLSIGGENVRIGIEAPKEFSVHREEIYCAILKNPYQKDSKREGQRKSRSIGHNKLNFDSEEENNCGNC